MTSQLLYCCDSPLKVTLINPNSEWGYSYHPFAYFRDGHCDSGTVVTVGGNCFYPFLVLT